MAKDPKTGAEVPWNPSPQRWIDGSVDNDLPMARLAELFNVNHFIVSQVNPHVVPFLAREEDYTRQAGHGNDNERRVPLSTNSPAPPPAAFKASPPGWLHSLANLAKGEALHRMQVLSELGLFPNTFSKLRSVLSQRYSGDITILPEISYEHFPRVLRNPTPDFMHQAMLAGERATWPKLSRIQNHCAVELAIDDAVQQLRARVVFSPSQVDLRLHSINAGSNPNSHLRRMLSVDRRIDRRYRQTTSTALDRSGNARAHFSGIGQDKRNGGSSTSPNMRKRYSDGAGADRGSGRLHYLGLTFAEPQRRLRTSRSTIETRQNNTVASPHSRGGKSKIPVLTASPQAALKGNDAATSPSHRRRRAGYESEDADADEGEALRNRVYHTPASARLRLHSRQSEPGYGRDGAYSDHDATTWSDEDEEEMDRETAFPYHSQQRVERQYYASQPTTPTSSWHAARRLPDTLVMALHRPVSSSRTSSPNNHRSRPVLVSGPILISLPRSMPLPPPGGSKQRPLSSPSVPTSSPGSAATAAAAAAASAVPLKTSKESARPRPAHPLRVGPLGNESPKSRKRSSSSVLVGP